MNESNDKMEADFRLSLFSRRNAFMDISGFRRTIHVHTVPVGQRTFLRCMLSVVLCISLFFFMMQTVRADDPAQAYKDSLTYLREC